jgi:hypothetical protein
VVGTVITITGSGFASGPASVRICGIPALFTVMSSTTIHATVPHSAAGTGAIMVINKDGFDDLFGFTPLYPGPWVQPPDQVAHFPVRADSLVAPHSSSFTGDPGSDGSYVEVPGSDPPIFTEVEETGPHAFAGAYLSTAQADDDPLTHGYQAELSILAVDLGIMTTDEESRSVELPSVNPPPEAFDPPDVWSGEFEWEEPLAPDGGTPGGHYLGGGFDVVLQTILGSCWWVDEITGKTANPADDIWTTRAQWRRFDTANLTFSNYYTATLITSTWPIVDGTIYLDSAVVTDAANIAVPFDNYVEASPPGFPPTTTTSLHFDDAALDAGMKLALVFALDRTIGAADMWAPPYFGPRVGGFPPISPPYSNGAMWKEAGMNAVMEITFSYRPPRYRLFYTSPGETPDLVGNQGSVWTTFDV